ncbi:uncharacterized protein LOC123673777 [Harmonia axyridis]|uniref:uncharacterized protein LOC123673777 n=1 Tax=Harmonia axyridis TaxID=115357 RepID=UPI001E276EDE|nr:uncharacterized protein LOC123673777 [Harmonia axyridis]
MAERRGASQAPTSGPASKRPKGDVKKKVVKPPGNEEAIKLTTSSGGRADPQGRDKGGSDGEKPAINLQHSKAASSALCWRTSRRHVDIGLIQEPWINGGQVRGLPNKVYQSIYCDKAVSPRALIILRRGLTCLPLTEFLTRDLAAALVEVRTENIKRQLVIASGYFPGDAISPPPEEVQRLIEWCRIEKKQLILGCDANAHHKVWGSTDINHRGEDLLDFLFSTNIEIVNVGNSPTFMNAIRREVIDLTLATPFIAGMVKNWRVSEEPSMSDHMAIEFNVEATASADVECRIPRKTDWELYIDIISIEKLLYLHRNFFFKHVTWP